MKYGFAVEEGLVVLCAMSTGWRGNPSQGAEKPLLWKSQGLAIVKAKLKFMTALVNDPAMETIHRPSKC
jgi:hypothetical protein